jgi:2-oxoglutarate ferredoxin oxidoreductase subunit alpha
VGRIVLAPATVGDCFHQTVNAFNLAETYQTPVILLSDTVLATRTERVPRPNVSAIEIKSRLLHQPRDGAPGDTGNGFERYALTESGVSPMSVPGIPGGMYVATGLEHSERGRPRYDPKSHTVMTEKRFRKLEAAMLDAPPAERFGDPAAEIGVITWGSTMGPVAEAVQIAAERGIPVEAIVPKMLWPLPDHQIGDFMLSKRVVLVPEVNYTGQFADLLAARYARRVVKVTRYGGVPFRVEEIVGAIEEASRNGR